MNSAHTNPPTSDTSTRRGTIPLLASALVLLGLVLVQAGRSGESSPVSPAAAFAEMAVVGGAYSAMTTQGQSSSEELLYVLDQRAEQLMVYRAENGRTLTLQRSEDLAQVFAQAKAAAGGGGR
ncbi:MAG: hypothetical protein NCW75_02375 [Phycisphaera sp.]|nr:MAG: hypothetical protein NCW75_02375 [Phycisphaera sp.]